MKNSNKAIAAAQFLLTVSALVFVFGIIAGDRYKASLFAAIRRFILWFAPRARYGLAFAIAHTVVAGRRTRRWWDAQGRDLVLAFITCLEYHARQFVAVQAADLCPAWLPASSEFVAYSKTDCFVAAMTIRGLKALASKRGLVGYGHMTKAQLVAALSN